ncbi:MAG: peptidoglycan DD-metalloendopeptidase family protein [Arachidicoccus sp.]|nr:peptidoglycan DD-metalloendopeptidase family protein [Arachidicoccus sp.]
MHKKLFVLSIVVFMAFVHSFGQQTRAEIQQRQKELQQELDDLNTSLSDVRKSQKISIRELNLLEQKIKARQQLIVNINNQLEDLDETIVKCNREVDSCKRQLDTLRGKYAESLVFAYKNRNSYNYINFLFSSSSFNDAFRRVAYLKSYRQFRESQAAIIVKAQAMLTSNIAKLEASKKQKNNTLTLQGSQLEGLQSDRKDKDSTITLLKGQEGDLNKEIAANAVKRRRLQTALQAAIRREIAEAERRERERQAKIAAAKREEEERERIAEQQKALTERQHQEVAINTPTPNNSVKTTTPATKTPIRKPTQTNTQTSKATTPVKPVPTPQQVQPTQTQPTPVQKSGDLAIAENKNNPARENRSYNVLENTDESLTQSLDFEKNRGKLPWPVSGGFISESYGIQTIPGTTLKQDNPGIEISTNSGNGAVRSVASGMVSVVLNDDGYSVIIRHGKYFTTYNNLSSVNVNRGDEVKAGTVIGQMSSDGATKSMFFMVTDSKGNSLNPTYWIGGK